MNTDLIKADRKISSSPEFILHRIQWGERRQFDGNEVRQRHGGVGYDAVSLFGGSGPHRLKYYDQGRYPNQGFSCLGCPHLLVDLKYGTPRCSHPHYIEMYGVPQNVGTSDYHAPPDCPMLGFKSERMQRRARWHHKSHEIFWRYYHEAGLNPYKEGFKVYR